MGRGHRSVSEALVAAPKPLDMAEIAARRQGFSPREAVMSAQAPAPEMPASTPDAGADEGGPIHAARQQLGAPSAAAVAPPAPAASPPVAVPSLTMADRAARHRLTRLAEAEIPAARAPSAPVRESTPPADDETVSMADRAAEAVHRRREAAGPVQGGAPSVASVAPEVLLAGTALVLVTRNHAGLVAERLQAWRALLGDDLRLWVLDLGSTDASAAEAEAARARLIVRPGGLVAPMATLDAAMRQIQAEVVVFADADARPNSDLAATVQAVKAGPSAAAAPRVRPSVLAVSRKAWNARPFSDHLDIDAWTGGDVMWLGRSGTGAVGFVGAAVRAGPRERLAAQFGGLRQGLRGVPALWVGARAVVQDLVTRLRGR